MRGVVSAGMVSALEELGLTDAFDAVYGSSAGAINAAYFLAGQARLGTTIYYENINDRRFIDLTRPLRGRSIVNLEFLLGDVVVHQKRLAVDRVLASPSPLAVVATDVDARVAVALRGFTSGPCLLGALRAGATMPVVGGLPYVFRGRRYFDAALSQPIPVPVAEADGHTHILALLTRTGDMRARPSAFDRLFVGPRLRRLSPELARRYLERAGPYAALLEAIRAGTGPVGRARVVSIRAATPQVARLERRGRILEAGARAGYEAARTTLKKVMK